MNEGDKLKGRYRIIQDLKRGAFGRTYLAEDEQGSTDVLCIVKEFKPTTTTPSILEEARRRFELEALTLEKLGDFDQIPSLLDHFEDREEFYLVQEFIEGQDLSSEISSGQQLTEAKVVSFLHEALEILAYIHQQNVIHRDIKPSNLLRRKSDYKIVILDFGAVKEIETLVLSEGGQPSGSVVGTPGYMPIEHLSGRPRTNSDIYALGMTAIEALTGVHPLKLPRDSQNDHVVWQDLVSVSDELKQILDQMVRLNFRDRYQTAADVLKDLQGLHYEFRNIYRIGSVLNQRYQILSLLGDGKYGNTYLAADQNRNRSRCIVKEIQLQTDQAQVRLEAKKLFDAEAEILHNLGNHDQIPELLDDFQENNNFYLVNEYVDGNPLSHEFNSGSKWSEAMAIAFLEDVLQILVFVHQQAIHFDIKPSNLIRRSDDGKMILVDFGSVKQIATLVLNYQGQLSITGVVGTPGYMPEEQKAGKARPNADLYALGITTIQGLSGKLPTQLAADPNTAEINWKKFAVVSPKFAAILNRMTHSYVRARYDDPQQVLDDLYKLNDIPDEAVELEAEAEANTEAEIEAEIEPVSEVKPDKPQPVTTETLHNTTVKPAVKPIVSASSPRAVSQKKPRLLGRIWLALFVVGGVAAVFLWPLAQGKYYTRRCNQLLDAEQPEAALSPCEQVIAVQPNSPEGLKNYGDALYSLERYDAARVSYENAIAKQSDYVLAWNGLGQTLYRLKRYDQALEAYDTALNIDSENALAMKGRGLAFLGLQDYSEALAAFEAAILAAPGDAEAWENKGLALEYLQQSRASRRAYEEGIALLEKQINNQPDDFVAAVDLGRMLGKLQRHSEALEAYNQAIEINPKFYRGWIGKGNTKFFLQQFEEALQAYETAAEIRPKFYLVWHNRGSMLMDGLQRYDEAINSYQKALELNPEFAPAWRDQGQAYLQLEQYENALKAFDQALKLNPEDSQSWANRGVALTQLLRDSEAIAAYQKALDLNPNDPLAWANFAWALEELRRYNQAIEAYDRAIQLKPDFTPAIESRQQLIQQYGRY
ncbi:MAG: tetratricopeptide repeat protein [Microcoleaceae cyanobacterium]